MLIPRATALLRLLLVLAYPVLAHLAGGHRDPRLAALALADVTLIVLLRPLLEGRLRAWLALVAILAALAWLARDAHLLLLLLLVPVAIVGLVAWTFGHTLRAGSVPLITRIVCALDGIEPAALAPDLRRYTRGLTAAWAGLLAVLALANLTLALVAVPNGILASFGVRAPLVVTSAQWSWLANVFDWGIIGSFFVLEFLYRKRRFPGRYHSLLDFLQRMARLDPAFWRQLLH